jgi:hypothetical protein
MKIGKIKEALGHKKKTPLYLEGSLGKLRGEFFGSRKQGDVRPGEIRRKLQSCATKVSIQS